MDVEDAVMLDEPKKLDELNEDIIDALGLQIPKGKEIQAIYSR
jgi:hypothetical protein